MIILKNLLGRKVRTLLTLCGIAVGVAAVVALGALAEGVASAYGSMGSSSGADVLVMQDEALDIVFSAVEEQIGDTLEGYSDVVALSKMIYTFAATEDMPYFILYGYEPGSFAIEHFKIIAGTGLSRQSSGGRGGHPIILGRAAADDFDKQVGDTFKLYESNYRIVGIYETGAPIEDGGAVILLEDAQALSGKPRQVNAFLLKVRPGCDIVTLRARIESRYKTLTATTSADFESEQDMLQYITVFQWSISLIAILIGGVGVMNTVMMSVFERTQEFGVLRALGWRSWRVLRMVLGESLLLSLLGGALGVSLGMLATWGVQQVPMGDVLAAQVISLPLLAQGFGIAIGLGVLGGGFPAWQAARLQPAEAMRYEGGGSAKQAQHVRSSALRHILRQPVRTLLTLIGIAIAMLAIVTIGALSNGMLDAVTGLALGGGAHLVGSQTDASFDLSQIDENTVRRMASLPGVRAAEGFLTGYTAMGNLPFFIVFGYQPRGIGIQDFPLVEGQALATNRQIMLGRVAAENLDKRVGQTLRIFNSNFKIVGIYETGVTFQDGGGVISLRDAQKLFGEPRKVSFMGLWLESPELTDAVQREATVRFPEVTLARASEFSENLSDVRMMDAYTWGISAMALLVGGLGMANTMVMSVFERTREIGVLRALGWRKRRVLQMIIGESVTLSLLGCVLGVAGGAVVGYLLNQMPVMQSMVRMTYTPELIAQTFGTALMLGIVGGIYPAWRASNLQPVEALRYE